MARVFYTLYMASTPKAKYNTHCKCGAKLVVPTWADCNDCTNKRVKKYNRKYQKTYKKKKDDFYHNGYLVKIPLVKYYFAEGLLYDYDEREIIGWR